MIYLSKFFPIKVLCTIRYSISIDYHYNRIITIKQSERSTPIGTASMYMTPWEANYPIYSVI